MSSIVIHIRFTEEVLAHACDGIESLHLPPSATLNDLVRTAVNAGLAVMVGHDWMHRSPTHEGYERVRSLTKQPMKSQPSDLIMAALNRQVIAPASVWDKIDIMPTINSMPDNGEDHNSSFMIWNLMAEGHVTINDQLTCNDGVIDRLASYLLWHHREHFPNDLELIEQVYNEYHRDPGD